MRLRTEPHAIQTARWPASGRHIMAQFDADAIVVYQAYRPSIGTYAATHNRFGGPWSLERMSWLKPNFLWMMYRCGWATKEHQEVVLAIWLARSLFDEILAAAVPSSYWQHLYPERAAWEDAVKRSEVRLQWDPDHGPGGQPLERRAIQLGLRGPMLARYASPLHIEDITPFVREQRAVFEQRGALVTPEEHPYPVVPETATRLGI
ncbi:MAG: DUF4291 domain-containing protein [Kofleriaceae bacterium]